MENRKVFIISCYDMGSSSIEGIYDTLEGAEAYLLKIVQVVNARLIRRKDEFHQPFVRQEFREDYPDVLVEYRNRVRVMEIGQYEMNKPCDEMIGWYDYFKDDEDQDANE